MRYLVLVFLLIGINYNVKSINAPVPSYPQNGATFTYFTINVSVNNVTGAKGYQFQFDTLANFSSPWMKFDTSTYNSVFSPELKLNKTCYWRARAIANSDTSPWSVTFNFMPQFGVLGQNSPTNNSTGAIVNLVYPIAGNSPNIRYIFEVDTAITLNSSNKLFRVQSDNKLNDSILFSFGRTIFWRVKSFNSFGDTFGWTPIWKYTFHQMPALNASTITQLVDPRITPNWTNAGLSTIQLQADTSSGFNTSNLIEHFIEPGIILDTLKNLGFGKDYYYRIRAIYKGKYSNWSFIAPIRVTQNGNINSPTNGSAVGGLSPNFGWRQLNGTRCQFQLYADSAKTILIKDTITQSNGYAYKNELKLKKWYNFRMRYFHDTDTAAWLSSNFRIYTGQVNLANMNATNISVRVKLSFRKQTWATGHVMEIDTGSEFGIIPSSNFIRVDSFQYDGSFYHYFETYLKYGQNYIFRVYAIKDQDTSEASTKTFTTIFRPINYSPQNNYIGTGPSTNALVTGILGSQFIQWELDSNLSFESPLKQSGIDLHVPDEISPQYIQLNFPKDLKFKTKYYWRTRCINPIDTSSWSLPFNFLTTQDVWLTSPLNNALNISITPKLEWGIQGSTSELRYQYQFATDSNFVGTQIFTLPVNSSPNANINCLFNTKYYWRARAYHTKDTSAWSAFYSFTTIKAPTIAIPSLLSPANAALNVAVSGVTLNWSFSQNANSYDIEVSSDSLFSNVTARSNTVNTSIQFVGLTKKTKYFWRVRSRINEVFSAWSNARWFETGYPSGFNELGAFEKINIFPNPASNTFKIELDGDFHLKIIDIKGKLIYQKEGSNSIEINSSNWQRGIYFIYLQQDAKFYSYKMLIE
jgi:hypothetical protein